MAGPKILIIEDEPDLRDILQYHLKREGFDVSSTANGYEAVQIVRRDRPDVVLLDLMIEGLDGLSVCRALKNGSPVGGMQIIIISARVDENDVLKGLELGADDYVRKPFKPKEVIARIRAVLRRVNAEPAEVAGEVLRFPPLTLNHSRHEVTLDGGRLELTATEYRILHHLMAHPERVFTRMQLLQQFSAEPSHVTGRNIDVHIRSLRRSLGLHAGMIETARGVGYRFVPSASGSRPSIRPACTTIEM